MRKLVLGLVAGTALTCGATAANAVGYIGSTTGCFGAACAPGITATYGGLTFNQGTFNQQDSNGYLSIGAGGPVPSDTLGLITLTGAPFNYNSPPTLFNLLVSFSQPGGLLGSYQASLIGSVSADGFGGVTLNFDNTPHLFTYSGGAFTLTVNDLSVSAGAVLTPINGFIQAVPEPGTWALMLLGFGAIGMTIRHRRRPALAQLA